MVGPGIFCFPRYDLALVLAKPAAQCCVAKRLVAPEIAVASFSATSAAFLRVLRVLRFGTAGSSPKPKSQRSQRKAAENAEFCTPAVD
jgi:hypothetical protein